MVDIMNIQLLTPKFFAGVQKNQNTQNVQNSYYSNPVMPSKLSPLKADTVSFSGGVKLLDFLESQYVAEDPRLRRIANVYLRVVDSIANKLKDKGFSFDIDYCMPNCVKSPKSKTSKVLRSKSFNIPDTIRTTLYNNDPYDLSKLNNLFKEMEECGYVLDKTEMSVPDLMKRGYLPTKKELVAMEKLAKKDFYSPEEENNLNRILMKEVPDLDIRLDNDKLTTEAILSLPPELKYSIGKPQKSGYEDIQIRFVRDYDEKKSPVRHEMIILFGPEYSVAKHDESSKVYNFVRKFGELRSDLKNKSKYSDSGKMNRYIDLVKQMFSGKVSQKLFTNAKNKDYAGITNEVVIKFDADDVKNFEDYFKNLKELLENLYNQRYKRTNIPRVKRQLTKDYNADKTTLDEIYNGLKGTIEHYNSKAETK